MRTYTTFILITEALCLDTYAQQFYVTVKYNNCNASLLLFHDTLQLQGNAH